MRRSIILVAGVCTILIAIVATAAWFFFVQQTKTAINQWADIQRENGTDVTWQGLRFTGFPLRIDTHFDSPQIIVRQRDRRAIWKPSFLTFKFSSLAPNAINLVSPGSHDLNLTSGNKNWSALVEAETLQGQALFPAGDYQQLEQLVGRFAGVRVTPFAWADPITAARGNFDATLAAVTSIDPQAVHPQGNSLALNLTARDIGIPPDLLKGNALEVLGPLVNAFSSKTLIKGELNAGSTDIEALTAWRNDGGTVEFTSIDLQWGPLRITADGTLALDGALQPVGSFSTRIAGLEQFVNAMEKDGVLSSGDAAIARITLAVLTRASEDGGPDRAEIPITLQDRILRLGPVALIEFPPIDWR